MAKQKSQGEAVRQNNLSHIHTPNWQILVELELRAGGGMNGTIHESLMESLTPLHLHTEFLCKLSKFAQDATARSMQVIKLMKLGHLHHIAFVPALVLVTFLFCTPHVPFQNARWNVRALRNSHLVR